MGQNYSQLTEGERNQLYALRKAKISMTCQSKVEMSGISAKLKCPVRS